MNTFVKSDEKYISNGEMVRLALRKVEFWQYRKLKSGIFLEDNQEIDENSEFFQLL